MKDAACFACQPPGIWPILELQILCEILAASTTCVTPGNVTLAADRAGDGFVCFNVGLGSPAATEVIINYGTIAGGPYSGSATFAIGDTTCISGLINGTPYYFVAYGS